MRLIELPAPREARIKSDPTFWRRRAIWRGLYGPHICERCNGSGMVVVPGMYGDPEWDTCVSCDLKYGDQPHPEPAGTPAF